MDSRLLAIQARILIAVWFHIVQSPCNLSPPVGACGFASDHAASGVKTRLLQGYKAQCEPIVERIEKLVSVCEARNESLVMEGVHLSINAIVKIMAKHPSVLPFLVYISNEVKHKERFAVSHWPSLLVHSYAVKPKLLSQTLTSKVVAERIIDKRGED